MKKIIPIYLFIVAIYLVAFAQTENKVNPNLLGAYRLTDGNVVCFTQTSKGKWRFTDFKTGKSHLLYQSDNQNFYSADDWNTENPAVVKYQFNADSQGKPQALGLSYYNKKIQIAQRINFREEIFNFKSGEVSLFGKLTLPENGNKPFPLVVFVHGSDNTPSVDSEKLPFLLAANGIATFVFDKRGTGKSKGEYTQHFGILADDVVAAIRMLKNNPRIDQERIGLAGFSQGGWVAPLAATKESSIKFILIGYGMTMSIADEDRLEAPLKLKAMGFSKTDIEEFQDFNGSLHRLAKDDFKDWSEFESKIAKYQNTKWFSVVKETGSWAGSFSLMGLDQAKIKAPQMFGNFFLPFYDSIPTLESLQIPMLWMVAADDIEAPPEPTIMALRKLRKEGKPFETIIFPKTDHGLVEFKMVDGKRIATKYPNTYFPTMANWLQRMSKISNTRKER